MEQNFKWRLELLHAEVIDSDPTNPKTKIFLNKEYIILSTRSIYLFPIDDNNSYITNVIASLNATAAGIMNNKLVHDEKIINVNFAIGEVNSSNPGYNIPNYPLENTGIISENIEENLKILTGKECRIGDTILEYMELPNPTRHKNTNGTVIIIDQRILVAWKDYHI